MVNTWLLFAAFTLIPVGLFWFLDRTSAIRDTSLFAAVVVGVGYQRILAGSVDSVRAPADISKFWQPFASWADAIATRITDRVAENRTRFDEKLLSSIAGDPQKFNMLKRAVMTHAPDPQAVQASLDKIAADHNILDDAEVQARQTSSLYINLQQISPKQFEYLLYKDGVISRKWYFWYAREWRSKATAIAVALFLACAALACSIEMQKPQFRTSYFVWRLRKENASDFDRYRAQAKLTNYLSTDPSHYAEPVYSQLISLLRTPNVSVTTSDRILSLVIETSRLTQPVNLRGILIESLRADNPDVRARVQKASLYLTSQQGLNVPPDLQSWQPDAKDSPSMLDSKVRQWRSGK